MIHLRSVHLDAKRVPAERKFPFHIPLLQSFDTLEFHAPVTIFVGENGSGKSTLLEGIAAAVGSITVGEQSIESDPTLQAARELASTFKLTWQKRTRKGFFLRAEDFINYANQLTKMRAELEAELREAERIYKDRPKALALAKMPFAGSLGALHQAYGEGLDKQSHGESFFNLFHARFQPGGLYLLDEPETPLSPLKQLAFLSMIRDMAEQDCQFIIATHSPILMAYPGAVIYGFDELPIRSVPYNELEHVKLTRDFLNNPESFLRHL